MGGPDPRLKIEVTEEAGDWAGFVGAPMDEIAVAVSARLPGAAGLVTVALGDDALLRELNARFRGKDRPTNVLAFPSGAAPEQGAHLGDVVLAAETLGREAAEAGRPPEHHFVHLVVHGVLHLLGHDHGTDAEADAMEALETAVLAELGLPDPYAAPHPAALPA